MKAHFIGISGKGMSAVALLLREKGWEVSGSDEGFYPPVSTYLEDAGIFFAHEYKKENIPTDADVIIIGKNAKLVPETNEEVRAAYESGVRVASFPDMLEELTQSKETIVVVGSYGKSTTTALLSWCLKSTGKDPNYFIGEITRGFAQHASLGSSDVFVLEGDEYPSSNIDPTPKFLHYNPKNVLLTSATHDHVNVYPTHADYLKPFEQLLSSLPEDGLLVANGDEEHARRLAEAYGKNIIFYGMSDTNEWYPANITFGETTMFDLMRNKEKVVAFSTKLLGSHNIENIVGAAAMLLSKELLTPEECAAGVASFQGVKRRLELLTQNSTVPVLEGFGSSYEKARSAIEATRLHFAGRRLIVVFEPHTFSWRNRGAIEWYDSVFTGADRVYIYEPASQGSHSHEQLSQNNIVERVSAAGITTVAITSPAETLTLLEKELKEDDIVLLLTSGSFDGLIEGIPALAEQKFPTA
ncbi:MAG TPA: Mur ligase family protein [Candidatus Paceibacterota bacterium]|nr:Mur ligase family protein [Candidatus Paceibacterota bacterium]